MEIKNYFKATVIEDIPDYQEYLSMEYLGLLNNKRVFRIVNLDGSKETIDETGQHIMPEIMKQAPSKEVKVDKEAKSKYSTFFKRRTTTIGKMKIVTNAEGAKLTYPDGSMEEFESAIIDPSGNYILARKNKPLFADVKIITTNGFVVLNNHYSYPEFVSYNGKVYFTGVEWKNVPNIARVIELDSQCVIPRVGEPTTALKVNFDKKDGKFIIYDYENLVSYDANKELIQRGKVHPRGFTQIVPGLCVQSNNMSEYGKKYCLLDGEEELSLRTKKEVTSKRFFLDDEIPDNMELKEITAYGYVIVRPNDEDIVIEAPTEEEAKERLDEVIAQIHTEELQEKNIALSKTSTFKKTVGKCLKMQCK